MHSEASGRGAKTISSAVQGHLYTDLIIYHLYLSVYQLGYTADLKSLEAIFTCMQERLALEVIKRDDLDPIYPYAILSYKHRERRFESSIPRAIARDSF